MNGRAAMLLAGAMLVLPALAGEAAGASGRDVAPEPDPGLRMPDDPYAVGTGAWGQEHADQWALQRLRVYTDMTPPPAQPVIVAVIDTGIDYTHEDFAAERLWHNPAERQNRRDDDGNGYRDDVIGWDFVDDDPNPFDVSGHGTHVAGIIAACTGNGIGIAGVNPSARIMPLKVANFAGQARSAAVAAAIHYAVDHGARIINLSLGGELVTELERQAADRAREAGVLLVVAAGNKGLDTGRFGYPGLPGALVVGASNLDDGRAGFSNFGADIDVLAPGVDVLSLRARDSDFIGLSGAPDYPAGGATVGEDGAYYRASGTSFAAALVSGLASRILAVRPGFSADDLRRVLLAGALDLDAPGTDQTTGHGRVDLIGALGADPGDYVEARLTGVELSLERQQVWLAFTGTAEGSEFAAARLEVRADPDAVPDGPPEDRRLSRRERREIEERLARLRDWQILGEPLTAQASDAILARRRLDDLMAMTDGITAWEVRLVVDTVNGGSHESRLRMALPAPTKARDASDE